LDWQALDSRRFLALAWRLGAYQGVIAARLAEGTQDRPARRTANDDLPTDAEHVSVEGSNVHYLHERIRATRGE